MDIDEKPTLCVFCREPVKTVTRSGIGTVWTHTNGFRQCKPTYAAPNLV